MFSDTSKYYAFLLLTCLLSIPFYIWGAISPVAGLPFGLPISFLMIFVPFLLSLLFAWKENGASAIIAMFKRIFDIRKSNAWAALFCTACMPVAVWLSFYTMQAFSLALPAEIVIPLRELPAMLILYFLGAIPEEFGWTLTLSEPMARTHGPVKAGAIIGGVWALWHVIPWSWKHPMTWIVGMVVLNILMRIGMIYAFIYGGKSLFFALIFHTMINVSMGLFPNSGSHTNPWVISIWLIVILGFMWMYLVKKKVIPASLQVEST